MKQFDMSVAAKEGQRLLKPMRNAAALVALLALPELALAAPDSDFEGQACGFLSNIKSLLGMASVAVVTIAIVFAGYQIAFAHKRISDVAPILIGGLLIGGASQLAAWILGDEYGECSSSAPTSTTSIVLNLASQYLA